MEPGISFSQSTWRDTARPLRFFIFDARVLWALLIWAGQMRLETFVLALLGMSFFAVIELFGLTPMAALRYAKNALAGPARPLISPYDARRRSLC